MSEFVGLAKVQTMRKDFDTLRRAIKSDHDIEAADDAWDNCERWLGCIDATATNRIAALEKENADARAVLDRIDVIAEVADAAPLSMGEIRMLIKMHREGLEGGK